MSKGMRPQNGYNRTKWDANYDTVFAKKPKKARKQRSNDKQR